MNEFYYDVTTGKPLFEYKLISKPKQKNIILSIKNNLINISCPVNVNLKIINNFISANLFDIKNLIEKYNNKKMLSFDKNNSYVSILQKKIDIVLVNKNIHTKIINQKLFIKTKQSYVEQNKLLYSFLKNEYSNLFIKLLSKWIVIMNENVNKLSISLMNNKWGICYKNIKRIVLNLKLIHFDIPVIEYVIVHELAHLEFPYHNLQFWNKVKKYMPNYENYSKILKEFYI